MSGRVIKLTAPSRLHFGLFSTRGTQRTFGGVGAMVESPGLSLRAHNSQRFEVEGPLASRAKKFAERWTQYRRREHPPACRIVIEAAPPEHVGLGTGTQLGLSVARILDVWCGLPQAPPAELAKCADRGARSAIGTYGFFWGGFIVEGGKRQDEGLSPFECRLAIPHEWRFVLMRLFDSGGLSGIAEETAFRALPAASESQRQELIDEVRVQMVPALRSGAFEAFGESVYRFGHASGLLFASLQGGAYNGPRLSEMVQFVRSMGVHGVGQSSWGPTLYALCQNETAARELVDRLRHHFGNSVALTISEPNNGGNRLILDEVD